LCPSLRCWSSYAAKYRSPDLMCIKKILDTIYMLAFFFPFIFVCLLYCSPHRQPHCAHPHCRFLNFHLISFSFFFFNIFILLIHEYFLLFLSFGYNAAATTRCYCVAEIFFYVGWRFVYTNTVRRNYLRQVLIIIIFFFLDDETGC